MLVTILVLTMEGMPATTKTYQIQHGKAKAAGMLVTVLVLTMEGMPATADIPNTSLTSKSLRNTSNSSGFNNGRDASISRHTKYITDKQKQQCRDAGNNRSLATEGTPATDDILYQKISHHRAVSGTRQCFTCQMLIAGQGCL
jgi:hypothetical protein